MLRSCRGWRPFGDLVLALFVCGIMWLTGCASPPSPPEEVEFELPTATELQPGDTIRVDVFREPDFSGEFRINEQGAIRHPLMGSVVLAGLTVKEAEDRIVSELAERYLVEPRVVVSTEGTQRGRFVLLGEVKNPGVYPYPAGDTITLLEAIAKAGGFTAAASVDRVRLVRTTDEGSTSMRIRVSRVLSGREPDVEIQPNDVITIPEVRF